MDPEELRRQLKKWLIIGVFFALAALLYALKWRSLLVAYLVVISVLAVLAILLQSGRGGGLATSLGGLGGESLLGARAATPIARATYVMLALFIFSAMLLARMGVPATEEVGLGLPEPSMPLRVPAPALPEPAGAPGAAEPAGAPPAMPEPVEALPSD
jgi:preprotein translocase subunit SecG